MQFKRIVALILALAMCALFAACDKNDKPVETTAGKPADTTSGEDTTAQPPEDTTSAEDTTSGEPEPSGTSGTGGEPEIPDPVDVPDSESVKIGNYVTLIYNAATCDVEYEVKRGVGSRQTVTLTVKMKDDFIFDGWSIGNALANSTASRPVTAASKNTTYTFDASYDTTVYLNTSMTLVYHPNGGKLSGGMPESETFSLVFYKNPNTRVENRYFLRDGYTLVGYNTKEDGTGEAVSLGGKVTANGAAKIDLYCMWEKNTPEDEFTYTTSGSSATITGYTGNAETVVIPQILGGCTVTKIAEDAFYQSGIKTLVIAKTVKQIEEYAFDRCENLETLILFDASFETSGDWRDVVNGISERSFFNCESLKNIRINTVYTLYDTWQSCGAAKIDRLIWAADKKKIIIIGGSGSLYGYNGSILEEALGGEYEIINLGENANINALLYFDIAEDFIGEGDIILWSPEPGTMTLGTTTCGYRFWDFRKSNYDFLKYIDVSLYTDLLPTFSTFCTTLASSSTTFKRFDALSSSMDKYGDDLSVRAWDGQRYSYSFRCQFGAEDALKTLLSKITEKGGSVYFSFAAMQKSGMASVNESEVLNFEALITSLPGVVSISDYRNCIYDDEYFWNSAWHMTDEGAQKRSEQVASDILAQLAKEGK